MLTPVILSFVLALLPAEQGSVPSAPAAAKPDPAAAARLAREGQDLYRQGSLGEALLKFEDAIAAGAEGGDLFYQTGYCYKEVRQDLERAREYMTKAVPLLEKMVGDPALKSPAPFYYLSAAWTVELGDSAKGADAARRGIALVDKGTIKEPADGESLFQIGRLYSLAGRSDKAVGWYEKAVAALDRGKVTNRQYLVSSVEQLSRAYMNGANYEKGTVWLQRLLELEPQREQERLTAGLTLVKTSHYKEAMAILRGFTNDDLGSEANYIVKILSRHLDLGSPALPPEKAKLDDAGLLEETRKAAAKLAEIRQNEDSAAEAEAPAELPWTWVETKKGKRKVQQGKIYPPPDWQPKDPDHPTPDEVEYMMGTVVAPKRPVVPPSPERAAAEKEFFALMLEDVRRGHLVREKAVINGFASLIFR